MSAGVWVVVAMVLAVAFYGAGAVGWRLGRRSALREHGIDAKPVPREVPQRARADRLVDLGDLSDLLDRRDVLIVGTVTAGTGVREEVVETAVLDTTGVVRLDASSLPAGDAATRRPARPWPAVHGELVELLAAATLVVGYSAARHMRMLAQTAERHGMKKLPARDWGCLMRRYTETTAGAGAEWIELTAARTHEAIAAPDVPWGPRGRPGHPADSCASWRAVRRRRPSRPAAATDRELSLPSQGVVIAARAKSSTTSIGQPT